MRDHLIGYLLEALEPEEHAQVEAELSRDPGLKHELELLSRSLQPLAADRVYFEPPHGLAHRTCEFVTMQARVIRAPAAPEASRGRWSLADLAVAAGIFLAATMLFFPALNQSRFAARLIGCQNNLREIGTALTNYSDRHGGYFPNIAPQGRFSAAGIYAIRLVEGGYLANPRIIVCPASALAVEGSEFHVPTSHELQNAGGTRLIRMQRQMGGSYGYNIGYVTNGRYRATVNLRRPRFAIMADAPADPPVGSLNHGECGQNVLFEDLHVQYLTTCKAQGCKDDIFVNDNGQVAAGTHQHDAVVGASQAKPLLGPAPLDSDVDSDGDPER